MSSRARFYCICLKSYTYIINCLDVQIYEIPSANLIRPCYLIIHYLKLSNRCAPKSKPFLQNNCKLLHGRQAIPQKHNLEVLMFVVLFALGLP